MGFFIDVVGVRVLVSDRNVFIWARLGHLMTGCVHVDDELFGVIFWFYSGRVYEGFDIAKFKLTGRDRLVADYCALEVDLDLAAQTTITSTVGLSSARIAEARPGW